MTEWIECTLDKLGEIVGGATPSTKCEDYYGGSIPWITPKDLSSFKGRYITSGERNITEKGLASCSAQMMPKDAVLFTSRAPIGYVAIASQSVCTNQGFKSIVVNEKADPLFVYYLLKYNKDAIEAMGSGTTFKEVSGKTMRAVKVRIPLDVSYQKRIAAVLDSLDTKIENNERINDNLVELCKTEFMRTFATHPEYRDEQSDWFSQPLGKSLSRVAMGPFGSNIKTDCFVDRGVPVLNGDNISGYLLSERSFRYVEEEKANQLKNSIAFSGDIVITHRGTLGQVALVPDKTKFDRYVISQSQFLLTCDQCALLPEYVLFYFHTDAGRRKLLANDNTTGVPSIAKPTSYIKALHIPIPPIELQQNWAVLVSATLAAVADNNLEIEKLTGFAQTLLSGLSR